MRLRVRRGTLEHLWNESRQVAMQSAIATVKDELEARTAWATEEINELEVVSTYLDRAKEPRSTPEVDSDLMAEKGFDDLREAALGAAQLSGEHLTAEDMDFLRGP